MAGSGQAARPSVVRTPERGQAAADVGDGQAPTGVRPHAGRGVDVAVATATRWVSSTLPLLHILKLLVTTSGSGDGRRDRGA